jgi:hypothetical protein
MAAAGNPDGTLVATGGEGRSVWVVETESWTIAHRLWVGVWVEQLAFTSDGRQLVIGGEDKKIRVFDTKTWKPLDVQIESSFISIASEAKLAVTREQNRKRNVEQLVVWSVPDWKEVKRIDWTPKDKTYFVDAILTPDGKTAYVRTSDFDNPAETEKKPTEGEEKPKDRAFTDGKSSRLLVVDIESGQVTKEVVCFDKDIIGRFQKNRMFPTPTGVIMAHDRGYVGVLNVKAGTYEQQSISGMVGEASGQGRNGNLYMGSSTWYAAVSGAGNKLQIVELKEKLPGWPEYFAAFAPCGSDKVVGVTSGYRMIVIDTKTHKPIRYIPLY